MIKNKVLNIKIIFKIIKNSPNIRTDFYCTKD